MDGCWNCGHRSYRSCRRYGPIFGNYSRRHHLWFLFWRQDVSALRDNKPCSCSSRYRFIYPHRSYGMDNRPKYFDCSGNIWPDRPEYRYERNKQRSAVDHAITNGKFYYPSIDDAPCSFATLHGEQEASTHSHHRDRGHGRRGTGIIISTSYHHGISRGSA